MRPDGVFVVTDDTGASNPNPARGSGLSTLVVVVPSGTAVEVVLDRTPFYAEGGGQLADNGVIASVGSGAGDSATVSVSDVQSPLPGLIVHRGTVTTGEIAATAYHALGIDLATELPGPQSRPLRLVDHGVEPIEELF